MGYFVAICRPASSFKTQSSYGYHDKKDDRILREFYQESKISLLIISTMFDLRLY